MPAPTPPAEAVKIITEVIWDYTGYSNLDEPVAAAIQALTAAGWTLTPPGLPAE